MTTLNLQKMLNDLLSHSDSVRSLPAESQDKLRKNAMSLPELQMEQMILVLQNEQMKMKPIQRDLDAYARQMETLTINTHMAAGKMKRSYAGAIEEADQANVLANSEDLLKQL